MSRRHSTTLTNYHAVIVSSAHWFVQCRIGGRGLPVKRPCDSLNRYWTTSADGRVKYGVTANRSAFSGRLACHPMCWARPIPRFGASNPGLRRGCSLGSVQPGKISFDPDPSKAGRVRRGSTITRRISAKFSSRAVKPANRLLLVAHRRSPRTRPGTSFPIPPATLFVEY
jgi:hypothetical protein